MSITFTYLHTGTKRRQNFKTYSTKIEILKNHRNFYLLKYTICTNFTKFVINNNIYYFLMEYLTSNCKSGNGD